MRLRKHGSYPRFHRPIPNEEGYEDVDYVEAKHNLRSLAQIVSLDLVRPLMTDSGSHEPVYALRWRPAHRPKAFGLTILI